MNYFTFAAKICFYEFLQDEFKPPHFLVEKYSSEISELPKNITIEGISKLLEKYPKAFDILEEVFQLDRFNDSQYIHFCFDVSTLNNAEEELLLKHINNHILKYENGKINQDFADIYNKVSEKYLKDDKKKTFFVKRTIIKYISYLVDRKNQRKRNILYTHINNSLETRIRISRYVVDNLNGQAFLNAVNLEKFLKQKRHPIDSKGLKGKYGHNKIERILKNGGFSNITSEVKGKTISPEGINLGSGDIPRHAYVSEKFVDGVIKRKTKKPKKFDFILLHNGIPSYLIETNFYSTSGGGTKIGINEGEYTDLHQDIRAINKGKKTNLNFIWVTDGNYWLSKNGEDRFNNLKTNFFKKPIELLNFNLLEENLSKLKECTT